MEDRRTWNSITDAFVSKHMSTHAELMESFIAAYLMETGLSMKEICLVQEAHKDGSGFRYYLDRKDREDLSS